MKIKSAWIVLAITLLIVLPTRIYQVLFLVEPGTGFYTDGNTTTLIISACLIAGILLMAAFAFADKEKRSYRPIHSLPTAVIGALTGLGLIFQNLISLLGTQEQENRLSVILVGVFGILAGAVFILTAYNFAMGQNTFEKHPLLSLIPSLWGCVSLVTRFITYISVVNVSENIYDTFTVIFSLLFLFAQAKMLAGIETEKSVKQIYTFGIPAILMTLVTGVPSAVVLFSGEAHTGSFPAGLQLVNILMALYILAFLSAVWRLPAAEQAQQEENQSGNSPDGTYISEKIALFEDSDSGERQCIEFLRGAYSSEEKFAQREKSPFQ